jgi:hypothetical protein
MVIWSNLIDTVGIFNLFFIIASVILLIKNYTFIIYLKNNYKKYIPFFNLNLTLNYFNYLFNNFLKLNLNLILNVFYFFKKKK